jgi:hypothetical protein
MPIYIVTGEDSRRPDPASWPSHGHVVVEDHANSQLYYVAIWARLVNASGSTMVIAPGLGKFGNLSHYSGRLCRRYMAWSKGLARLKEPNQPS